MAQETVYSDVTFVKKDKDKTDGETCVQAPQQTRSRSCDRVHLTLVVLCVCLTAGLVVLTLQYITEKKLHAATKLKHADTPACRTDWKYFKGNCYLFISNKTQSWTESRDACVSDGGHLVVINSREEQEFLTKKLRCQYDQSFWIGLTDMKTEGQWVWIDNSPLDNSTSFWAQKQPDDWKGDVQFPSGEDCVRISEEEQNQKKESKKEKESKTKPNWYDAPCQKPYGRICETESSKNKKKESFA